MVAMSGRVLGVHGQEQPQDVQARSEDAAAQAERTPNQQHREGLTGDRHGRARDRDRVVGGQRDEQRTGDDQEDVADPGTDTLTESNGDQEVADGDATFRDRQAIES